MIIKVRMIANGNGEIRSVQIPDNTPHDRVLNAVYRYGQNDVQPRPQFSVSVGDVIEFGGDLWMVTATGFKLITEGQYQEVLKMDRFRRSMFPYAFSNY